MHRIFSSFFQSAQLRPSAAGGTHRSKMATSFEGSFGVNLRLLIVVCTLCSILPFSALQSLYNSGRVSGLPSSAFSSGRTPLDSLPNPVVAPSQSALPIVQPGISSLRAFPGGVGGGQIMWRTDKPYRFQLNYGTTEALGQVEKDVKVNTEEVANGYYQYSLFLKNPMPDQPYYYQISAFETGSVNPKYTSPIQSLPAASLAKPELADKKAKNNNPSDMGLIGFPVGQRYDFSKLNNLPKISSNATSSSNVTTASTNTSVVGVQAHLLADINGGNGSIVVQGTGTDGKPLNVVLPSSWKHNSISYVKTAPLYLLQENDGSTVTNTIRFGFSFANRSLPGVGIDSLGNPAPFDGVATYMNGPEANNSPSRGVKVGSDVLGSGLPGLNINLPYKIVLTNPLSNGSGILLAGSDSSTSSSSSSSSTQSGSASQSTAIGTNATLNSIPANTGISSIFCLLANTETTTKGHPCPKSGEMGDRHKSGIKCPVGSSIPKCINKPATGKPVSLEDGSHFHSFNLMSLSAGVGKSIDLSIYIDSRLAHTGIGSGNLGRGLTLSYSRVLKAHQKSYPCPPSLTPCVDDMRDGYYWYLEDGTYSAFGKNRNGQFMNEKINQAQLSDDTNPNNVGGHIITYVNTGEQEIYDASGSLILIRDRLGNEISKTYSSDGKLITYTNNRTGQSLLVHHALIDDPDFGAARLKAVLVENPQTGQKVTLEYGVNGADKGRLIRISDPAGNVQTLGWDDQARVVKLFDANNDPRTVPAAQLKFVENIYHVSDSPTATVRLIYDRHSYRVARQKLPSGTILEFNWLTTPPNPTIGTPPNQSPTRYNQWEWDLEVKTTGVDGEQKIERYRHTQLDVHHTTYDTLFPTAYRVPFYQMDRVYAPDSTVHYHSMFYLSADVSNGANQLDRVVEVSPTGQNSLDPSAVAVNYSYSTSSQATMVNQNGGGISQMFYDTYGQLTKLIAPTGETTLWQYAPNSGILQTMTRTAQIAGSNPPQFVNQVTQFITNQYGMVCQTILPDGTVINQDYDLDGGACMSGTPGNGRNGYPTQTTYDFGQGKLNLTSKTLFDDAGKLISSTNQQGVTCTFEYYANDWLKAIICPSANGSQQVRSEYTYDGEGNVLSITQDKGGFNVLTKYQYGDVGDGYYAPVVITDSLQQVYRFNYDGFGNVTQATDPAGHVISYTYNSRNQLVNVIAPDGTVKQTNTYTPHGRLYTSTDARGVTNQYTFDSTDFLTTLKVGTMPVGDSPAISATYTYGRDASGRLKTARAPNIGLVTYNYDGFGRLESQIDNSGNKNVYSYNDASGQVGSGRNWVISTTIGINKPAEALQTVYSYDRVGRTISSTTDPCPSSGCAGHSNLTMQYSYDVGTTDKWNLQQVQDPRGNLTKYKYNLIGLLASMTDANNQTWSYDYDNRGLLTTIRDPLSVNGSRDTSYFYDLLGRTITTTRSGKSESWNYNPDGTLARYTGIGGNYAVLGYNDNLELTSRNYFKANGTADPSASASFQYYPNGLLKTVTDNGGGAANITTYSYDAANRLISRSRPGFNGAPLAIGYEYNLNSTLKNLNYWGTHGQVSYGYDSGNRVNSFKPAWGNANQAANTYLYRSTNALATVNRPSTVGVNTNYGYDTATRNTGITNGTNGNRPSLQYGGLDGNNNPAVVTATQSLAGLNAVTSYNFDKLDRLTRSLYPGGTYANTGVNYGYDAVGNLTSVSPDNAGKLNTIAGTQDAAGYTGDGGNATAATLRSPRGIAVGPDGAVYIADSLNRVVRRISPSGVITTVAGNGAATPYTAADEGKPATSVSLINPIAITVGAGGRLLIADEGNSTVRAVTFDPATGQGTITLIAGTGTAGAYTDGTSQENVSATSVPLNGPSGVAIGTNGMIYISDRDNHIVRKVNQTGKISTVLGTPGQAGFGGDGQSQTVGTTKLSSPQRLVLNADGYLYVADLGNNRLRYVTFDGSDVGSWGNGFNRPVGVAAAPDGSIYVGDLNNQRVARVAPDGTTTTVAGTGTSGSSADGGNATATTLRNPTDVAIGPDGVLLIVEPGTQRIRSVGIATTYSHNTLDQLEGYTYDASGNLTREPNGTVYVYNAANQLIQTIKGDGYTTYKYDGLGNLIQQAQSLAGNVTDLVWEEGSGQLLGEVYYNRVSGAVRDEYLYGYGPEGFAAQLHKNSSGSNLQYPLTDRIGSVMQLLNTNGQVVNSYTYNAFGTVRQQSMGENTTLRFAGARANPDGTIYLGSRVYQPQLGKFLQRDSYDGSVGDGQSQNRYSYVQNNPVNYVDPSGYSRELPSTAAGANAAVSYSYRSANLGIGGNSELSLAGANANNSVATSAGAGLGGVSSSSGSNSSNSGVATAGGGGGATVGFGVGTGSTAPSAPSSNPNPNSVPFSAPTPCRLRKQEEQEEGAAIFGGDGDDDSEEITVEYWSVLPAYKWRRLRTVKFYR
jgi:RHS repeat-associated protein